MKTLQTADHIVWRFKCDRCRSRFEMTNEEKLENDWKYDEGDKNNPYHTTPSNPMNYFDCPICHCRRIVRRSEMHKVIVMDDGTEVYDC